MEVVWRSSRGADVETRREIFEQLLPEETFVDRRLLTEAPAALAALSDCC